MAQYWRWPLQGQRFNALITSIRVCQQAGTYVGGLLHDALLHVVHPVLVHTEAVWLILTIYQALEVLADKLEQLLEDHLGLLRARYHISSGYF